MLLTKTPDLYFAAYIIAKGHPLQGTKHEGNRIYFLFEDDLMYEELRDSFFNCTGEVPAQPYSHQIKSLKSLVHA
jgi:hypothetical protein